MNNSNGSIGETNDEVENFREALKSLGFPIMRNARYNYGLPLLKTENNVLPGAWNLFTIRSPFYIDAAFNNVRAPKRREDTATFITSSSLTNRGHKSEYFLPEALAFVSELKDRAAAVLNSAAVPSDNAAKLVILSMAWQGPESKGETTTILGGRGKYPLAEQVEYVRRGYSYDDVYLKEKYKMTFDEWEENRDLPRSYLVAIFGEQ